MFQIFRFVFICLMATTLLDAQTIQNLQNSTEEQTKVSNEVCVKLESMQESAPEEQTPSEPLKCPYASALGTFPEGAQKEEQDSPEPMKCPYASVSGTFPTIDQKDVKDQPMSVVEQHARYFSDNNKLTKKTITDAHTKQKITAGVYVKQRAILNMLYDRDKEPTASNIAKFYNPSSTGIWDQFGNFDEKVFEQLCKFSVISPLGTVVIKSSFDRLRKLVRPNTNTGDATHIFAVVPVPWIKITDASIDELFKYYHDKWYIDSQGKYEPAFSISHLRAFYENPVQVMEMRVQGLLPAKSPI